MSNFNISQSFYRGSLWTIGLTPTKYDANNGNDLMRERLKGGGSHTGNTGGGSMSPTVNLSTPGSMGPAALVSLSLM